MHWSRKAPLAWVTSSLLPPNRCTGLAAGCGLIARRIRVVDESRVHNHMIVEKFASAEGETSTVCIELPKQENRLVMPMGYNKPLANRLSLRDLLPLIEGTRLYGDRSPP